MANLDLRCAAMVDEYRELVPVVLEAKAAILEKLNEVMRKNGLLVTTIEARVKAPSSLEGKLELKGHKYQKLRDVTDLIGARIVVFYSSEVDKIASIIEKEFEIDWLNSVDKRKMLDTNQFGYLSLHYVCYLTKNIYENPDYPELNKFRFELQMRTALQHVWATAYHDTGYKSDMDVPHEYLRSLSRLAGLLEIADEQFSQINNDLTEYRRKVKKLVKDKKFEDISLNLDSFISYLELKPFDRLNQKIAAINKAEIQEQSYRPYYPIFSRFGFKTLADIENLIQKYSEDAYQLALIQIGNTDIDILSCTIGVQNLCLVYLLKEGYGESGVIRFFKNLHGERKSNESSAKRIYKQALAAHIISEPEK